MRDEDILHQHGLPMFRQRITTAGEVGDIVKSLIRTLTDQEREDIFSGFQEYCRYCGTEGQNCNCRNDE